MRFISEEDPREVARQAARVARVALILAAIAVALSILGLFLPIS